MSTYNNPTQNDPQEDEGDSAYPCVLVFNANDPSGAGGITADILSCNSVGAHTLPIVTGCYIKDSAEILSHVAIDSEGVSEQARAVLEDVNVQVFKVGFCGGPEALSVIAEVTADYADLPVIAYMPSLSWWEDDEIEAYWDAFRELILPQTTLLIGNYSTLSRWLLPDWSNSRGPTPRDLAKVAGELGVPYTLVTGITPNVQTFENVLCTPYNVLLTEKFERQDAVFTGTGDTLSAVISALISVGCDLEVATKEALHYLDGCLLGGYQPGMGLVLPDRLFWTQSMLGQDEEENSGEGDDAQGEVTSMEDFGLHKITTRH
jgi:hydroxymethylpyrimidine/phosphomethylpyrimidine kinase